MKKKNNFDIRQLKVPLILLIVFWVIAIAFWQLKENIFFLFNFGYIGTSIGVGLGIYQILPKKKKHWGRRLAQILVGTYMLVFLGIIMTENMQIEGFFLYLLAGIFSGSTIHYLVAKLAGPVIFSRGWCGWSCWTAMILDLLPYKRNKPGRLPRKWEFLRHVHFALSLGLVLVLWYGFDHRVDSPILCPTGVDAHWQSVVLHHRHRVGICTQRQSRLLQVCMPDPSFAKISQPIFDAKSGRVG